MTRTWRLARTNWLGVARRHALFCVCALVALGVVACSNATKKNAPGDGAGGGAGEAGSASVTTGDGGLSSSGAGGSDTGSATGGGSTSTGGTGGAGGSDTTGSSAATSAGEAGGAGMAGAGGSAGMGIDAFCELLQARARSWLRECRSFGDSGDFWGTQRIDRFCSSGRAAVEAGRLEYDPVQAEACAALSVGGCEDIEAFAYSVENIPQAGALQADVCEGVVTGLVPLGGACHGDSTDYAYECSEGYCTTATCPGTCTAYASIGGACDLEPKACDPSVAFCNSEGDCQAYVALGGGCDEAPCTPGDLCRFDETEGSSRCVPSVEPGGNCDPALTQCAQNLECYQGVCVDQVPLGATCVDTAHCPASAYCNGTCVARVPVDGDCSLGQTCVDEALCDGVSCVVPGAEDEPCPCASGLYCDDGGTCRVLGAVGADCTTAEGAAAPSQCEAELRCVPSEIETGVPVAFACQPQGGAGDPCLPQTANTCRVPFFCHPTNFTCSAPAGADETCNFALVRDSCQADQYCACVLDCDGLAHQATAECTARLDNGSECTTDKSCASSVCSSTCQAESLCR